MILQKDGTRTAVKVFAGGPDFKSLKREIEVVRSLPHQENIVRLEEVEEDVSTMLSGGGGGGRNRG